MSRTTFHRIWLVLLTGMLVLLAATLPDPARGETVQDVTAVGVPNDGSDVTKPLQDVLRSAPKPCTLVFPKGTYRFGGVTVPPEVTLRFDPAAIVRPAGPTFALLVVDDSHDVSIEGGRFFAEKTAEVCVLARRVRALTVSNVRMYAPTKYGVSAKDCEDVRVSRCIVDDAVIGVDFIHTKGAIAEYCSITNMLKDGILFYDGSSDCTATGNTVDTFTTSSLDDRGDINYGRAGIQMYGSSGGHITGNTVRNGIWDTRGIRFRNSEDFYCADNVVDRVSWVGIEVAHIPPSGPESDFEAKYGLYGGDGVIERNTVRNVARGIVADDVSLLPIGVADNTVAAPLKGTSGSSPVGICVLSAGSVVVNNTIESAGRHGILAAAPGGLFALNTVSKVGLVSTETNRAGVYSAAHGVAVVDNHVFSSPTMSAPITFEADVAAFAARNTLDAGTPAPPDLRPGASLLPDLYGDVTPPVVDTSLTVEGGSATLDASAVDATRSVLVTRVDSARARTALSGSVALRVGGSGLHRVSLRAEDMAGNHSLDAAGVAGPTTLWFALGSPRGVSAGTSLVGGRPRVTLRWTNTVSNTRGACLERAEDVEGQPGEWRQIVDLRTGTASSAYHDMGTLTTATRYHYRIRNYWRTDTGDRVFSAYSRAISARTRAALNRPIAFTGSTRPGSILLSWKDRSPNETGFVIYVSSDNKRFRRLKTVRRNVRTYRHRRSRKYYYKVRAVNSSGSSAWGTLKSRPSRTTLRR